MKGAGVLDINFDFSGTEIYPSRIKAMIGKNGTGKSRTLKEIKNKATRENLFKKVVAINVYQSVNRTNDPSYSSLRIDFINKINITSSILHLLKHRKKYQYFDTFEILKELFIRHFKCDDVFITINGEKRSIFHMSTADIDRIDTSEKLIPIRKEGPVILSTGQEYIVSMTLLLLLHITQYSCVIIDEPELYLHPNLIVSFKKILEVILKRSRSYAFISTHSIFLIRELPKESVHILYEESGNPLSRQIQKETFGASLDSLAHEIFYDEETENSFDEFVTEYKKNNQKVNIEDLRNFPTPIATRILSR